MPQFPGLDVSRYQGEVDWPTAGRLGRAFAFVEEFGWGGRAVNPLWDQQWNGAGAAGLWKAAYLFWRHDQDDAEQVRAWTDGLSPFLREGDGVMVDYEYQQPDLAGDFSERVAHVQAWLYSRLNTYPLLYSSKDWLDTHVPTRPRAVTMSGLFLAQWGWRWDQPVDVPEGWDFAAFVQDGAASDVPTTGQPADRDWFLGPISRLHLYGKQV